MLTGRGAKVGLDPAEEVPPHQGPLVTRCGASCLNAGAGVQQSRHAAFTFSLPWL